MTNVTVRMLLTKAEHDLIVLLKRGEQIDVIFGDFIIPLVNKINDFAVQVRYEDIPDVNTDLLIAAYDEASRLQSLVITKISKQK